MKSKKSLDKLIENIKQYHGKGILSPDDFIEYFNETMEELQITNQIDTNTFKEDLIEYLKVIDWFSDIGRLIAKSFFNKGLTIETVQSEGDKAQYRVNTQDYTNYIITDYLEARHKKHFNNPVPPLDSNGGVSSQDIAADWHITLHENGIKTSIETVASVLIEFERSYVEKLDKQGLLPEFTRIQEVFSNAKFDEHRELTAIQILEEITNLYLQQYELSSILQHFHHDKIKTLSPNIDTIFELYSSDKEKRVSKLKSMMKILDLNVMTELTDNPKDIHSTTVETPAIEKDLASAQSEPQPLKIIKEPATTSTESKAQEPLSVEHILEQYCEEKISDDEYRVVSDFYIMKEYGKYQLYKRIAGKKDEPENKLVSRKPFFVIARTHHIEDEVMGVRIASIDEVQAGKFLSFDLGAIEGASFKKQLNNKGYKVTDIKILTEYIHSIEDKSDLPLVITSNKVGWIEHVGQFGFVLPNGKGIGITGLEYSGVNPNLVHAIEQKGNLNTWLSIFEKLDLEKAHPRIAFLLFSALLPLFANYHDTYEGFTINITPDYSEGKASSNGKTTVQQLMLSLQGSIPHWHTNWNKSANAIEDYLHTNIGAYLDDTSKTKMTPQELEDMIYSISDAESRGTARQASRDRKTVLYSTGEKDFLKHTGKDGVYVRYVDVGIKRNDYGSNDSDVTRKIVDHIKKTVVSNYGFVYPEAIRIFMDSKKDILDSTDKYIDAMAQDGQYDNASRIAKRYAMIAVCGEVFIDVMRKLTGDRELYTNLDPYQISLDMFKVHDQRLLDMDSTEQDLSGNLLDDFINQFTIDSDDDLIAHDGKKLGYIKDDQIRIIKEKAVITDYLPQGSTISDLNEVAKSSDRYVQVKSNNFTRKSIPGKTQYRYFVFSKNKEQ